MKNHSNPVKISLIALIVVFLANILIMNLLDFSQGNDLIILFLNIIVALLVGLFVFAVFVYKEWKESKEKE